ncbi:TIGR01244 family sulfur transferase [Gammaproteobacteria bacterium AS21]
MEIHQLTETLSVSPQLNVEDIDQVLAAGFKTVICNRPDNEGEGQPDSDSIRLACEAKGLSWHYMPVSPKDYSNEQALEFGRLLNDVATPVLAFCRTGTRCTNLWALSQASEQNVADIISTANVAGYDIAKLSDRISALKG